MENQIITFSCLSPPTHTQLSGGCELTTVLQDFIAIHSNELSIQGGQTVELLERPSDRPGWCLVRTTDRSPPLEGLVPSSALCISHSRSSVEMECFFPSGKDSFSVSASENGGKSESVANLQQQSSLNSIHSSPGPKRSTNTLKKWLTSPVRRLNSGKAESNIKKQKKRDGRNLGSPKAGDETTPQGDSADEGRRDGTKSQMMNPHTLPSPMKIFDNDPTQETRYEDHTLDGGNYHGTQNSMAEGYVNEGLAPSPAAPRNHEEEQRAKALRGRMFVLNELVQTEKDYVKDLGFVVETYIPTMEERGTPEDMNGKDKIVFGNIHQIYDWHKDFFMGELEKCLQDPERLAQLFIKHERRLHMYVVYCQTNLAPSLCCRVRPYFEELMQEVNPRFSLSDFLIKPIQRITKYQLLLKYSEKAGLECSEIEGKLTAQGKLLQQDTFYVIEQESGVLSRTKERRVFLFEQIVIFSELLRKGSSTPGYMFKRGIKMNYLILEENVDNDPCKFAIRSRETTERVILQAANSEIKQSWVQDINQVLDTQQDFLKALQSPIEYQRRESNTAMNKPPIGRGPSPTVRPLSTTPIGSEKNRDALTRNQSLPSRKTPTSNGSPGYDLYQHLDKCEPNQSDLSGCNGTNSMVVVQDYYALKENEICVYHGEIVQILAVNQQNMYLVYRPSNDQSPAAEGWIPGSILGHIHKPSSENSDRCI
ncbi:hypothetical protein GDO86_016674, partial [Hymenochirus boettgeri]